MKKLQGFGTIDRKVRNGRCLNAIEQLLIDARALCPELCVGFTSDDPITNIAELMHITSYKVRSTHLPERSQYLAHHGPKSVKDWKSIVAGLSTESLDDFRMYMSGKLWQNGGAHVEPEVLQMVDAAGNLVDETLTVAVDDSQPVRPDEAARRTTWEEDLDPQYIPPHLRKIYSPLEAAVLDALDQQIRELEDARRPDSSAFKAPDWGKW